MMLSRFDSKMSWRNQDGRNKVKQMCKSNNAYRINQYPTEEGELRTSLSNYMKSKAMGKKNSRAEITALMKTTNSSLGRTRN